MTDKLRQAAQQMLEAVADLTILTPREWQAVHGLKINALRTTLAEPVTQCWKCGDVDPAGHAKCDVPACGMREPAEQEPVGVLIRGEGGAWKFSCGDHLLALYATPKGEHPVYTAPQPAKQEPLTDEEILHVLMLNPPEPSLWPHLKDESVIGDVQRAVIAIARAIEAAHGITKEGA